MQSSQRQVIRTNEAQCRDCYRCLRHCPVKAIRMTGNQAAIEPKLCLACGHCIGECPQKAKAYRHDLHLLIDWIKKGEQVAVSLAPSFIASFEPGEHLRLIAALRRLGVQYVAETAVGVELLAEENSRLLGLSQERPVITSACAAVVNLIEIYYPHFRCYLAPVLSPMLTHGAYLKENLGGSWKVAFIGPCLAKKSEADSPRNMGAVDVVLSLEEVKSWLAGENIILADCEESAWDDEAASSCRTYPLKGGHLQAIGVPSSLVSAVHYTACGYQEVEEALKSLTAAPRPCHIEAFLCPEGCVGGPLIATDSPLFERRLRTVHFATEKQNNLRRQKHRPGISRLLAVKFEDRCAIGAISVNEDAVREVLQATGKLDPKDQLNCGSCGFTTCRQKAIAVVQGMAVPEVCLPYMRRMAEQRTDLIIETSPNGIVILDKELRIIGMNKAFQKLFSCGNSMMGHKVSALLDANLFEQLLAGEKDRLEATVRHNRYGIICHEIAYCMPEQNQLVGIFVNLTETMGNQERLANLRAQIALQASELLETQVLMAQQIARMLGEHSAHAEKLVGDLLMLATDNVVSKDDWKTIFRPPKERK